MPHGTPDWGLVGPKARVFGLDDLGEHAVRLGSPDFFDRRGDVLFITDFTEGLSIFDGSGNIAGWAVCLATGYARTGAYCAKLTTPGGDGNDARLVARLATPVSVSLGLEFVFGDYAGRSDWQGYLDWWDGVLHYMARVRVNTATGAIDYYDNVTPWVNFATVGGLHDHSHPMHTLKLVVFQTPPVYVRVIINSFLLPLPSIAVPSVGPPGGPYIQFEIRAVNTADPPAIGFVDNVIVTQNEP